MKIYYPASMTEFIKKGISVIEILKRWQGGTKTFGRKPSQTYLCRPLKTENGPFV